MKKEEKLIFEANARRVMELEKRLSELLGENKRLSMEMDGTIAAMKRSSEESKAKISELSRKSKEQEKKIEEHEYAEFQSPCLKRKNHLTPEALWATMVR